MERNEANPRITGVSANGWYYGEIGPYSLCAKVYGAPSKYGIHGGRVSKLEIVDKEERKRGRGWSACIVNYDRGWDIKPKNTAERRILSKVLKLLESLPTEQYTARKEAHP